MTCPPLIWSDSLLLAGLIVYVCGMVSGVWLGFKLWRVTYINRSLGTRRH